MVDTMSNTSLDLNAGTRVSHANSAPAFLLPPSRAVTRECSFKSTANTSGAYLCLRAISHMGREGRYARAARHIENGRDSLAGP